MANWIKKCDSEIMGTGIGACNKLIGEIKKGFLLKRNTKVTLTNGVFTQTEYDRLVQTGKLVYLQDFINITPAPLEAVYEELGRGRQKASGSVYRFTANITAYQCLAKALCSLEAKSSLWDFFWIDKQGNINAINNGDGTFSGYSLDGIYFDIVMGDASATSTKLMLMIDFDEISSEEFRCGNSDVLDNSLIEVSNIKRPNGVIDYQIEFLPTNKIKVSSKCNPNETLDALELTNFKFTDAAGTELTGITIAPNGNGIYTVTGATGEAIVTLWDSALLTNTIKYDNEYYRTAPKTVVFT